MARTLIAGCGYVGTALAERLAKRGHTVFGLRRNVDALPSGVERVRADLRDPSTLTDLPKDIEYVAFTAAADGSTDEAYGQVYVDGLFHLIEALTSSARSGRAPSRMVIASSTAVYAQNEGELIDESSVTEPQRFSGKRMLQMEALALCGPIPSTVARFGGIYGPGRNRLLRSVADGSARVTNIAQWTNRIHRDDCAGVLEHLLTLESPERVYIAVDNDPADRREVLRWLADRLGAVPPRLMDDDDAAKATANKRCNNAALRASGYRFLYPGYRDGYAEIIAEWLRSPRD